MALLDAYGQTHISLFWANVWVKNATILHTGTTCHSMPPCAQQNYQPQGYIEVYHHFKYNIVIVSYIIILKVAYP